MQKVSAAPGLQELHLRMLHLLRQALASLALLRVLVLDYVEA